MDVAIVTITRPEITANVTRGAARLLIDLGYAPLAEVTLPNGRRADLMALSPKGELAIIEVKSGIEDYRVDRKWHEYGPFCDAFYFAVAPEFPQGVLPDEPGLIVADSFGGGVVQDAADLQSRLGSHLRRYENMTVLFEGSAYLFEFKVVELEQQYRWFRNADG